MSGYNETSSRPKSRGAELRSIANSVEPTFPTAADVLRGIAREVDGAAKAEHSPTPRPWPENTEPTPRELAEWLAVCTDEERTKVAAIALENARAASRCFLVDHEAHIGHLKAEVAAVEALADEWDAQAVRAAGERQHGSGEGDSSHAHYARTCRNHATAIRAAIRKDADA